jgi:hypothetical protein
LERNTRTRMNPEPGVVTLSLISHTNVGKTTLARTLLRRDIGEVRDQPHVTDVSEAHVMIETEEGRRLLLWDTPGFGDTARLLRRLQQGGNPIGWILSQVWDRFTDRPFWCSQQAIRNVKEEADVVLYLVSAAETPEEAGYVEMEMEILSWIGKPVAVLLNQTGPWRGPDIELKEVNKWRSHLRQFPLVKFVLSLDAFARCWVQEDLLLEQLKPLLGEEKRALFSELQELWRRRNLEPFKASAKALAKQLARACIDREELEKESWSEKIRGVLLAIRPEHRWQRSDKKRAMAQLAERLNADVRETTNALIQLHELEGSATEEILRRLKEEYDTTQPLDERLSALLGGVFSGALGGLAADVASGGLTFGGGAIVGAILGAAGAGGGAIGYNRIRGELRPVVRWSPRILEGLFHSALLQYLEVAHFGRGRGAFRESMPPEFWLKKVAAVTRANAAEIQTIWKEGKSATPNHKKIEEQFERMIASALREVLGQLYPESTTLFLR